MSEQFDVVIERLVRELVSRLTVNCKCPTCVAVQDILNAKLRPLLEAGQGLYDVMPASVESHEVNAAQAKYEQAIEAALAALAGER